ncbi:MAG: T9SS type A sorting domain-containing protein, partial [Bacteroidia bacterium]|nr:T9SS type A sorting domain-containing protein [Bacteroidia bacterium]
GSLLPNPTYTYSSAGSFSVQLVSVDTTYFSSYAAEGCGVMLPYQSPCQDIDTVNINITNIPCMSSSGFTYYPSGVPHEYYLSPYFPYNVTTANWNWGDGTSYTGPSIYTSHTYSASGFYNICLTVTTSCGTSTMTCINDYFAKGVEGDIVKVSVVQPTNALSVGEKPDNNGSVSIFPNPSKGLLFISMSNNSPIKNYDVYNALGEIVVKGTTFESLQTPELELDLSQLSEGIYFLNIHTETQQFRSKFVLEK